jgi:hypothetical protein
MERGLQLVVFASSDVFSVVKTDWQLIFPSMGFRRRVSERGLQLVVFARNQVE